MLSHCNIALQAALGNVETKRTFAGKLLGNFFKNKLIVNGEPLGKNSLTAKEFVVKHNCNFNNEKLNLINAIRCFATSAEKDITTNPHPFFGQLTPQQWSVGQYAHINHHLMQFFALYKIALQLQKKLKCLIKSKIANNFL